MADQKNNRPGFRLIQGGLHCSCIIGRIRVHASPKNIQPFPIDAIVFEEDTWLTISAEPEISGPMEHPIRLMTGMIEARPEPVGSVVIKGNHPLEFYAVVHDVDQEPTWNESWVEKALIEVFRLAEENKMTSIGLSLLGTVYGKLEKTRFAEILGRILRKQSTNSLKRIWLMAPAKVNREMIETLNRT